MKRVIVCDSGLGGLNVAAGFFAASPGGVAGEKCEVIYFNAYPEKGSGFNTLPDERSQEELFRVILESMKKYSPDLCLIACNTLSIVYDRLAKWYQPPFPVRGIVDAAVEAMAEKLAADPDDSLLILGTKTTVESGVYASALADRGFAEKRIKSLACPGLATLLESDPDAAEVAEKLSQYAVEVAEKFPDIRGKLYLAFCCTHFAFARDLWIEKFSRHFPDGVGVIDPNQVLVDKCGFQAGKFSYLSRIDFFPGARENMSRYFSVPAPAISEALLQAAADPGLF